jgi:hypothetical protein
MATYNPAYDYGGGVTLVGESAQQLPAGGTFVNGSYYFYAPSRDGGWNFYKATNTNGATNVVSISESDYLGGQMPWGEEATTPTGPTGPTGPTAEQLAAALSNYQNDIKTIENAYNQGLLTWQEKADAIQNARNTALQQRDVNTEQNTAYFQNVSPDAIQSQQGNYQNKIFESYKQAQDVQDRNQTRLNTAQALWGQSLNDVKTQALQNYQANIGNYQAGTTQMAAMPNYQNEVASRVASGAILPQSMGGGQLPMYKSTTADSYENWKNKLPPISQYLG